MKKALIITLLSSTSCFGQVEFLGKFSLQAKLIAKEKNIELSPEQAMAGNKTAMNYKEVTTIPRRVNLGTLYTLVFDNDQAGFCTMVSAIPSIQDKWVKDTLEGRLRNQGFKSIGNSKMLLDTPEIRCTAVLQYVAAMDKYGRKTNQTFLRLNYYLGDK